MPTRHRRYGGTARSVLGKHVAEHARGWAEEWMDEVCREETTRGYRDYEDREELVRDTEALYNYLALWLSTRTWDDRIDPHYQRIGRDRWEQGFPLSEVISAILLAKRRLWNGIVADNLLSSALQAEASKAISVFYDKAVYHTIVGYEQAGP